MNDKILSINDTVHGMIELTALEKEIISCSLFNRLHDVYQNSTVYLTFPTNRTKRFEHSVGTMYLCGEMLFNSLYNASISECDAEGNNDFSLFISRATEEIEKIKNDLWNDNRIRDKLVSHENLKRFDLERLISLASNFDDSHIKKRLLYIVSENQTESRVILSIVYQSARIAALLHDVGHPPFSHITEKALMDLRDKASNIQTKRAEEFIKIYDNIKNQDKEHGITQLHEIIGIQLVDNIFDDLVEKSKEIPLDVQFVKTLYKCLVWRCVKAILKEEDFWGDIHAIIDSEVDCDRLDYVVRDGLASGINTQIEYQRIISEMKLKSINADNKLKFIFSFGAKTLNALEDFFLKRMLLYKNVIFHHRVIKTDRLFKDVIEGLGIIYLESEQESKEDNVNDISFLWYALNHFDCNVDAKSLFLSQWDDSWLITILKQELKNLGEKYRGEGFSNKEQVIMDKLDEALTNNKYYFSAIKRGYDFEVVDNEFCSKLLARNINFESYLKKVKYRGENHELLESVIALFDMARTQQISSGNDYFTSKIFTLNYVRNVIWDKIKVFNADVKNVSFEEMLTNCLMSLKGNYSAIDDAMIEVKSEKGLVESPLYLHRLHSEKLLEFREESNINGMIKMNFINTPCFNVFVKKNPNHKDFLKINQFLKDLGDAIEETIYLAVRSFLGKVN